MESCRLNEQIPSEFRITSYLDFIKVVRKFFFQEYGKNKIEFTMKNPDGTDSSNVSLPSIVYSLVKMQPGVVGENARELKPRVRRSGFEPSEITGKIVRVIYRAKMLECLITFTVYGETNKEAYEWSEKLRAFLNEYQHIFLGYGIDRLVWESEKDSSGAIDNQFYTSRTLTYTLRFEEVTRIEPDIINNIDAYIDIVTPKEIIPGGGIPFKDPVQSKAIFIVQDLINKIESGQYKIIPLSEDDENYPNKKYIIQDNLGNIIDTDKVLSHDIHLNLSKDTE